ncbi:MAG: 3-methyl-2-oxobutanoate hydroxymethyltransferase [Chloroflexota bacterium]
MERKKVTAANLQAKKEQGDKIVRIVCYDYPMAVLADRAGVDAILVGDSVGMVQLGMNSTVPVTMEEMIHHCKAVMRGVDYALVIGDLPFMSYQSGERDAVINAGRLLKEGWVDAVKLEGGREMAPIVEAIAGAGILVMGHIGLTPQTASQLGGFKVQGKDASTASKLLDDAKALEEAGAFMLSLECVPDRLAEAITQELRIPVTGIGAGPYTDGQSILLYDLIGLYPRFTPKFVKKYANLSDQVVQALQQFSQEVKNGSFPGPEHSYKMEDAALEELVRMRRRS